MAETDDRTDPAGAEDPKAQSVVVLPEPESGPGPEADPKPEAVAAAPIQRRGGLVAPLLGGVLAAAAGFGLAQYVPGGWPLASTTALEQQLSDQAAEIARLEGRLATVESQPAPDLSPLMDTLAALNGRVADLETGPAETAESSAALAEAVAKLQADLVVLQAAGPVPADVEALTAEAEAKLQEAEAQAAQMTAEAEALTKAAAARAAFGRLQAAVDSGEPFAALVPELGMALPDTLQVHAETGVPSLTVLQQGFPDAARAALESALRANMGATWTERATSFLLSQTGARSLTPREGIDPDAILSRAEAALTAGDLELTLTELSALPETSQTAMAGWRAMAEQRQAAVKALQYVAGKIGG